MAKFLPNYQPVTWKNVNTGNPAQFFNGAIQGGESVFDQQQQINETEDARLTNEAIAGSLAGKPTPFNRRVDQLDLQQSVGYEKTLKSNLLNSADQHQLDQITIKDAPAKLKGYLAEVQAKIAATNNAAEKNRLQAEINQALADERKRTNELRIGTEEYDQHIETKRTGFYEAEINKLDIANPGWRDTQASRDAGLKDAEANSDINTVQYARSGAGRRALGTTQAEYAGSSIARILEQADLTNTQIQEKVDEGIYNATQKQLSDFQKTKAGDTRGFQIENGLPVFGNPESQNMNGGDLRIKLADAASKSGTTQFSTDNLDTKINGRLNDVAGSMSSSLADHIAKTVVDKHVENGGGKLSTDEFAQAFLDEAAQYREDHFASEIAKYEGTDITAETLDEQYRRGVGDVVKSDGQPKPGVPITYKIDTPKTAVAGNTQIEKVYDSVHKEIEAFPESIKQQYAGAIDRIRLIEQQVKSKGSELPVKQALTKELNRMMQIIRNDVEGAKAKETAQVLSDSINEAYK